LNTVKTAVAALGAILLAELPGYGLAVFLSARLYLFLSVRNFAGTALWQ